MFFLALYSLILLHSIVPHEHAVYTGIEMKVQVQDHHHGHDHGHSHHHSSENSSHDNLLDFFLALLDVHNHQLDGKDSHFQVVKSEKYKTNHSNVDTQIVSHQNLNFDLNPPVIQYLGYNWYDDNIPDKIHLQSPSPRAPPIIG